MLSLYKYLICENNTMRLFDLLYLSTGSFSRLFNALFWLQVSLITDKHLQMFSIENRSIYCKDYKYVCFTMYACFIPSHIIKCIHLQLLVLFLYCHWTCPKTECLVAKKSLKQTKILKFCKGFQKVWFEEVQETEVSMPMHILLIRMQKNASKVI